MVNNEAVTSYSKPRNWSKTSFGPLGLNCNDEILF
jgi:hypothetical protein